MKYNMIAYTITALLLASCGGKEDNNFQVINKENDGKISIINQNSGQLIVINKSNRIDDVVDLNIDAKEVETIKSTKNIQDSALKIKNWGESTITGTKYKVSLSTRHYKDKLLYIITFSPSDATSSMKARLTTINLRDENGFALEKINPSLSWVSVVNDKGIAQFEQASGEMPMTLDNYLEVSSYDPTWSFR
jgi:hypothetical protein